MQCRSRLVLLAILLLSLCLGSAYAVGPAAQAASTAGAAPLPSGQVKVWLQAPRAMAPRYQGKGAATAALNSGAGAPLALAAGDFDEDGVQDLVVGYATSSGGALAIYRGNLDAFAPQSQASFEAIGRGEFPEPFLSNAHVMDVPATPDFLATGDFNGDGHLDIVMGSRANAALLIFFGDGHGHFTQPLALALPGAVTALAAERIDIHSTVADILVSTSGPKPALLVFAGTKLLMSFPMPASVTSFAFGDLDRDQYPDTALVAGGQVMVLHGRDVRSATLGNFNFHLENVGLPLSAVSVDIGSFVFDRDPRSQMAVLSTDGSINIVSRSGLDSRPMSVDEIRSLRRAAVNREPIPLPPLDPNEGWMIAETMPATAGALGSGRPPIMMRTRISDHGSDDVVVFDSGQMHVLARDSASVQGTQSASLGAPLRGEVSLASSSAPVAALRMRVNIDGRPGMVLLNQGQVAPSVMMPLPDPTFTVNRTDDPVPVLPITNACNGIANDCSLREAVLRANATAGTDTVTVPAGTYTLTLARVQNDCTGNHGALSVNDSLNIVGAGQATTIIQAGTTNTNGIDMVMNVNEDLGTANCPLTNATASISNLTMKFGRNHGAVATFDGDGGCMEFDTGTSGNANLAMDHVTLTDCSTTDGNGGGIATFNVTLPGGGTGLATITNSIFQNSSVAEVNTNAAGSGGAIWVSDRARMSMSNSQILNNNANQVNGTGRGVGGGLFIFSAGSGSRQTVVHGTTITGNQASGDGGGIWDTSNLLIDNTGGSTVISGNTAGGNGGGIHYHAASPDVMTLSKVTITGNTATGNGGGIDSGEPSLAHAFTMSFSRLAGNTASAGSNLDNIHTTVTATDNWWGTNTPATTINNTSGGTTTFDPFIALTHTASPGTIKINQSTTLTGSLAQDNHGTAIAASNLDVLIGLSITFNNAVDGSIPQAQPETLGANVQATATFNAGGVAGGGKADATVDQATVTANIVVLEPLQITKNFNPTTVATNTPSTVTFSINNPNVIAVDGSFTDALPGTMVVAATPGVTDTCGGTVTAVAGSTSISFVNASLPVGACTITVKVSSPSDGVFSNSVTISSTAAGTGAQSTSSASLTVINPPTIAKAFGAATIPLNGTTSLTFTISNTNVNSTLNSITFTDSLPSGLVVASTPNLSDTCSGSATAIAGSGTVSLASSSLAPGTSCTVSVDVQGTTSGVKNNSVQASDTTAGAGNTSNALITVVAPPVIIKAFGAASIPVNGSTSLTFTIQNNNTTVALTGVAFSDTLPAGLVISTPNGLTGSCGGGTITATQGTNVISLSGASLAASTPCTFSVNVTGTAAGTQNNTTGNVTSTEGGTGGTASASVDVVAPPSIAKAFNPTTIALNATTSLTFTITNPAGNAVSLTGVAFTDTLPTGLTVANASATVCGGTLTTTAPTGIALSGATIAVNSQCQFSVTVTGAASGQYTNTTGNVTSTNGGTGNTATANLTVAIPPSITKVFGEASVPLNGTTSLTFTITNPNTGVTLTGLAFTDNLPAGLVVATPNALTNTCGGTATAVAGSSSISLSGGTLASSASCTVSVNVTGTTVGVNNNSVQVTSTEGGTGNTSNASITVVGPPVIIKAFGAASIPLNGSTSLTFTIQNNNTTVALSGVAFSDTLPAGLVISTPSGLTGTCGAGTITATQATNVISLSGGTIAASSSCTFSVNVTGTAAGTQNNTTGNVTSTEGGTGGTASTSINVVAPPSIAKVFTPSGIALNATASLTFTITNPAANAVSLTGVAFTDTLPTGLTVANASATVCGGTLTTTAPTGIALSGATIAVNSQCQFSVTVTGAAAGSYTNTTGSVSSTNGGTGNTATANLTVAQPPSITKSFGATNISLNGTTTLILNLANPNTNVTLTGLAFTDNLPAGLVVASTPNLNNTCGGTATAVAGAGSVSLSGGTLPGTVSCGISVSIQGTTVGMKNNSVTVTSTEGGTGNTSNASITVVGPPVIIKAFGAASIPLNGSTSLSFTIQNNNTTTALVSVGFSDTLPAGLVISTPNGQTGTCGGGTITATQGTNVISLAGASLTASTSCTFSINVTGTAAGTENNTTGSVTSTEGGTGGTASASIDVVAPPSIAKAFTPSSIALNATTSLTFTLTNPAANTVALTGVAFTDTLPTGLTVANASATVCGGTLTTTAPTGIALSGATINTNSQCQFSVTVTGAASGQYTNTTGAVTSTNGGTGNTASANLSVATPPTITKAFGAASILLNGTTSLSFTINNPNTTVGLTGIAFSDTLPAGLVVSTPNGLTGACGGGSITAGAGSSSISLSGAALASSGSCAFSVNVTGITAGVDNNTTGPISSNESGTGATSNTATITVIGPPSIAKAFGAASINLNATTTLSFTITNPNATVALTGVGFGDTLPAGLTIANPNGLTGSCGAGTITTGTVSGFSVVNLSGGTIAAGGSCTFSINVVGTGGGPQVNTTGTVTSSNAGSGNQATASINVLEVAPTITKAFAPAAIAVGTSTTMTLTIHNPNPAPLTGIAVSDTLPPSLVVSTPNALTNTCGGTVTAAAGSGSVSLTGGTLAANASCTITVNLTASVAATFNNITGVITATESNPGATSNTATLTASDFSIAASPASNTVTAGGSAAYTVTVTPNPAPFGPNVTLAVSGLPLNTIATLIPNPIAGPINAPSNSTLTILTQSNNAALTPPERPFGTPAHTQLAMALSLGSFGFLGMVFVGLGGGNRRKRLLWMLLGLMLLGVLLAGCGGTVTPGPHQGHGTPPGTYTITITGTANGAGGTSLTHSTTVTLVVN